MQLKKFDNELLNCQIGIFINNDNDIYFRGKDVANYLQYADTTHAIKYNVDDEDKHKLDELWAENNSALTSNEKNSIYINESGLYSLILRSNKEEAKYFKKMDYIRNITINKKNWSIFN